jgi:uncharacterized protein
MVEGYSGFVPGKYRIDGYGGGGFRFADMSHRGSILALPSGIYALASAAAAATDLTVLNLAQLFIEAAAIEFVIIGTGAHQVGLPDPLRRDLADHHLRFETMATGAAARTYNVLLAENRRVAAVLLAVA